MYSDKRSTDAERACYSTDAVTKAIKDIYVTTFMSGSIHNNQSEM